MQGFAYSLVTPADSLFAGDLVRNLELANQQVPQPLLDLAMQVSNFLRTYFHCRYPNSVETELESEEAVVEELLVLGVILLVTQLLEVVGNNRVDMGVVEGQWE